MSENRRDFIKKLGAASLFGLGTTVGLERILTETVLAELEGPKGKKAKSTRWGMVVDTTRCGQGCNDCIAACHAVHNVPKIEDPKEEIKWIWKEKFEKSFPSKNHQYLSESVEQTPILTFCNHCEEPPCVRVCPTKATFKSPDGIVKMDFHRCIGCRFCMAGCPYGSRSFNWRDPRPKIEKLNPDFPTREKGVVEKCNFCAERLLKGKQPACVEVCKEKALTFGNLHDPNSEIREVLRTTKTLQRKPELGTKPSVFYIL